MLELSSETTVTELQASSPAMMKALLSSGIFREGSDSNATIGDLCWNFGLNPLVLLNILARAGADETQSTIDARELAGLTLSQIVDNIESGHHAYLRQTMPLISELINRVVSAHGSGDDRLSEVQALFSAMSADLENHMLHEEEALFPMVRDMEADGAIKPTRCGDAVGGPITCMENEHAIAKDNLALLREKTDAYAVPEYACTTYRQMLEKLSEFDRDMLVHMHKEDKVLFPGALKKQAELRERNPAEQRS